MCFPTPDAPPAPAPAPVPLPEDPEELARRREANAKSSVTRDALVIDGTPANATTGTGLAIV